MTLLLQVLLAAALLATSARSQACGWNGGNATCSNAAPCCSEYGTCGTTPLHCGVFCQSAFSPMINGVSPCYASRPNIQKKCVSGRYNFDPNTWVINADAYNGDINTADWIIDPLGLDNGNLRFGANGGFLASITKQPMGGWAPPYPAGLGVRVSSTAWLLYGAWEARLTALAPIGLVTAFISFSEERDEIDWEIVGRDPEIAEPNFFHRGNIQKIFGEKGIQLHAGYDMSKQFATLRVEWTPDTIRWFIDGKLLKTVAKSETCDANGQNCKFPNTPSKIQFALWDGSAGSQGTREWTGGYVPWGNDAIAAVGFNSTVQYITVQCDGDPVPTGPPKRPAGYGAPSLIEPPIAVAVPGLSGYSAAQNSRTKSAYAK
ncbi:concanavalin A-like lectin/glucanase domain-containing protein [Obelidium mucronatum]|nr:concanavalin A-like lectin/glucanase domain-containing protein [Obelidium mucronatum]